jgi:hypothetical protein
MLPDPYRKAEHPSKASRHFQLEHRTMIYTLTIIPGWRQKTFSSKSKLTN